jgi:ABC-type hemin transport system substrate-binding protein
MSLVLVVLAACAGQREPAQKMMNDIEAAVGAAATDAAKYVPDQLNDVQTKLDDLKTAFNAQDYQGVLTRGPALLSEAQGLAGAAAAKKAQTMKALNDEWSALASAVPDELMLVHDRLDMLGQSRNRKLAKGVDLEAAHTGFDEATSQWSKAQGAFGNGNLDEAVVAGKNAKSKLETAAGTLKIDLPH